MMNIKTGVEKLFKVVEHSAKFDSLSETNNNEKLFSIYLSELKELENNLYKKLQE